MQHFMCSDTVSFSVALELPAPPACAQKTRHARARTRAFRHVALDLGRALKTAAGNATYRRRPRCLVQQQHLLCPTASRRWGRRRASCCGQDCRLPRGIRERQRTSSAGHAASQHQPSHTRQALCEHGTPLGTLDTRKCMQRVTLWPFTSSTRCPQRSGTESLCTLLPSTNVPFVEVSVSTSAASPALAPVAGASVQCLPERCAQAKTRLLESCRQIEKATPTPASRRRRRKRSA